MRFFDQIILNTSGETAEIIIDHEDEMDVIIRCPNCGQATKYGETRMISGYTGCDQPYKDGGCYWNDLMPRVVMAQQNQDPEYGTSLMYSVNRDDDSDL